jgi:hypothetical protein
MGGLEGEGHEAITFGKRRETPGFSSLGLPFWKEAALTPPLLV